MSKKYKAGKLDSFSKLSFWGFSHASSHPDSREFDNDDTQTHDQRHNDNCPIFSQHREVDTAHHADGVERVKKLREDYLRESNSSSLSQIDLKLS